MAEGAGHTHQAHDILCIGLFFDGTRNNAANLALQRAPAKPRAPALRADDNSPYQSDITSSFDNGLTHVARLQQLYQDSRYSKGAAPAVSIYVEGVGTRLGADDDLLGLAFGMGATGVRAKIDLALQQYLPAALRELAMTAPAPLRSIRVDLFGFSRGAAAARDIANQISDWGESHWRTLLGRAGLVVASDFMLATPPIRFIGLFDTVVAVNSGRSEAQPRTQLAAGIAERGLHLIARDEYREHFAVTTAGDRIEEIFLPGAHSDIGGGRALTQEGPKLLSRPRRVRVPHPGLAAFGTPPLALLQASAPYRAALQDAKQWRKRLGLDEGAVWVDVWHQWQRQRQAGSDSVLPTPILSVSAAVVLKRPIDWRYQLIALRLMQQRSRTVGVTWREDVDDITAFALPDALQPIARRLLDGEPLSEAQEALLRRDYITQSAHWNFDALGDTALTYAADAGVSELPYRPGPGLFYINRPTVDRRRVVLADT